MKKLAVFLLLGACGNAGLTPGCDVSRYDGLVGQNLSALDQSTGDFVIIRSGEVWTGGTGGETIVFLDRDRNILSFGCG
ncbi:hypothetical protein [Yoonia sediminilitoris]|uniref:Uncharacterized protein n=1 Tax=Yoonia sediminilitoris TaxID=1286148 RepID=A0A2T6KID3_9RHOB|nr:hypothetical protein [Yoonia sediminilitoris]PUB15467.1 hypothetical protein C8N45_10487 [Yoonia sediminilitoris]RCW96077.1 hypothetical protein DFP92_10487 [Yoonia sediminilitoris]